MYPQKNRFSYLPYLLILLTLVFTIGRSHAQILTVDTSSAKNNTNPKRKYASIKGGLDKIIDYSWTDSIVFNVKKNMVYIWGDAKLKYGDINLEAEYIEIDLNLKEIFARGGIDSSGKYSNKPVLKDGEESYTSDSMRYNANSKKGRVYGLDLKQDEIIVKLKTVLKQEDGSMVSDHGMITTCNAPQPHFGFVTRETKFIPGKKVIFGPAQLVVEGIPTPLAVPFGLAPLQKGRRNGLLFPSYGFRQGNKTFFLQNLGYYTGLGKYADLKLLSDLYLNGDFQVQAATSFVKKYKYRGNFAASFLQMSPSDYEKTRPGFKRTKSMSFVGGFNFDQKMLPGTSLGGSVNVQLGDFNRRSSIDVATSSQTVFASNISYARTFSKGKVNLTASARHSQNTVTKQFEVSLPEVNIGVPSITPFKSRGSSGSKWYEQFRVSYNMNFVNKLNTFDTLLLNKATRDSVLRFGIKNGFTHAVNANTNFKLMKGAINVTPSANYNEVWFFGADYQQYNPLVDSNQKVLETGFYRFNQYNFGVSANTQIYGTFKNLKIGKIVALRHTITPSIGLNYSPEIKLGDQYKVKFKSQYKRSGDQSWYDTFYYNNKFQSSLYRPYEQVETGGLSFGVNQNLQGKKKDKVDSTGKFIKGEKINLINSLSLRSSYNFLAKEFKLSNIAAGFATVLMNKININADASFDPYVDSFGKRINKLMFSEEKKLAKVNDFSLNLNTNLSPNDFKKQKGITTKGNSNDPQVRDIYQNRMHYIDFSIPWSVSLNYSVGYNYASYKTTGDLINRHTLTFSGDISITEEWKITYQNTLDLKTGLISAGGYGVSRNLHCWQLDFQWTPIGYNKGWVFTLRPKSGMLQDLKLNKRVTNLPFF